MCPALGWVSSAATAGAVRGRLESKHVGSVWSYLPVPMQCRLEGLNNGQVGKSGEQVQSVKVIESNCRSLVSRRSLHLRGAGKMAACSLSPT